jgi:hypothetical protein
MLCEVAECMQHPWHLSFHDYGKEILGSRVASSVLSGTNLFKEVFSLSASLVIVCNFPTSVVASWPLRYADEYCCQVVQCSLFLDLSQRTYDWLRLHVVMPAHKILFILGVWQLALMVRGPRCVNNFRHKKFLLNLKRPFPEANPDWSPDSAC